MPSQGDHGIHFNRWQAKPAPRDRRFQLTLAWLDMMYAVGVGAFLVAYNTIVNLHPLPHWTYVPVNLALTALLVSAARSSGQAWQELGLDPGRLLAGLGWGLGAIGIVAIAMAGARWLANVVPLLQGLLRDQRVADLSPPRLAYDILLRIPLGTAVCEEVLFRGVLFAALLDAGNTITGAVVISSTLFGLWHVGPTLAALRENEAVKRRTPVVTGAVVATTIGGVIFSLLRLASGSLTPPVLAHWGINASGLLAAHVYQRRTIS